MFNDNSGTFTLFVADLSRARCGQVNANSEWIVLQFDAFPLDLTVLCKDPAHCRAMAAAFTEAAEKLQAHEAAKAEAQQLARTG